MRRAGVTLAALAALATAGCGGPAAPPRPPAPPPGTAPAAAPAPTTLVLDTAPGLSGLAVAPDGALWTVAERAGALYRVVLDGDAVRAVTAHPLRGGPAGVDLEAVEVLADGTLLVGTEAGGAEARRAALWRLRLADDGAVVPAGPPTVLEADADRRLSDNHGIEGVCAAGDDVVVALEDVLERDGARLAQLERGAARHRVALTSATGKLSGLDCRPVDGGVEVLAIERHFEVSRLVRFTLPDAPTPAPLPATVVLELGPVAGGRNLEGVARLPDGRLALVADNQWRTIDGPSVLLLLPPPPAR